MGCGASSPTKRDVANMDRPKDDISERSHRKAEVLERHRLSEKDKGKILAYPIFKLPKEYMKFEHVIECAFFGVKDDSYTEITLFFCDQGEDEIVERQGVNFCLIKDDSRQNYTKVAFNHCWSGDDTWDTPLNDESHSHWCSWSEVEKETLTGQCEFETSICRPVLYVNTATHLLGTINNNAELEMSTVSEYQHYAGTARQATEVLLRASETANPEKKQVSALAQLIPVKTTHAPSKSSAAKEKEKGEKEKDKKAEKSAK